MNRSKDVEGDGVEVTMTEVEYIEPTLGDAANAVC